MKKFNFYVNYVEVNKVAPKITKLGEIPFSTMANTYEEGRSKALEFAQSIARCYESNNESAFFFSDRHRLIKNPSARRDFSPHNSSARAYFSDLKP